MGLFELMIMNDDLRDMVMRNASRDELRDGGPRLRHGYLARRRHGGRRRRTHHVGRSHSRNGARSLTQNPRRNTRGTEATKPLTTEGTRYDADLSIRGAWTPPARKSRTSSRRPARKKPRPRFGRWATSSPRSRSRRQKKAATEKAKDGRKRTFAIGGVSSKVLTTFTRQLSILQDAGLPILRSLRILENQSKPGRFKNSLMDVCDEIESGSTLSEGMAKAPKAFDRLYVNMIKAGEAGGALEVILQPPGRLSGTVLSLKRKIKGAMIYPVVVVSVAVGILTFIMIKIVPAFQKIFEDFDTELPTMTLVLIQISNADRRLLVSHSAASRSCCGCSSSYCASSSRAASAGTCSCSRCRSSAQLVEKNILARTTRTLGTLVTSGVPILEALNITRETSGNSVFEFLFGKISESIREGESIAKPMKEYSKMTFHPIARVLLVLLHRRADRPVDVSGPHEHRASSTT